MSGEAPLHYTIIEKVINIPVLYCTVDNIEYWNLQNAQKYDDKYLYI